MKKNSGITLIALVITIIIMLIIATISVTMLSGDNSLIHNAGEAKESVEVKNEKDIIKLSVTATMNNNEFGELVAEELANELNTNYGDKLTATASDNTVSVSFNSGRTYDVDTDGNVAPTVGYQWQVVADNDNSGTISLGDEVAPLVEGLENEHFLIIGMENSIMKLLAKNSVDPTSNSQSTNAEDVTYAEAYTTDESGELWLMKPDSIKKDFHNDTDWSFSVEIVESSSDEGASIQPVNIEKYGKNDRGIVISSGRCLRNYEQRFLIANMKLHKMSNEKNKMNLLSFDFFNVSSNDFAAWEIIELIDSTQRDFWLYNELDPRWQVDNDHCYFNYHSDGLHIDLDRYYEKHGLRPMIHVKANLITFN